MSIVSTHWLGDNLNKVKIIDCSWHLPNMNRSPKKEFEKEHIENAIFFDLDENSNKDTDLPHMMPSKNLWEKIISSMGISNKDQIIIYDNSDLYSSCRCWFAFIYFGHNPSLVHVLDGGFKKWKLEKRKITKEKFNYPKTNYKASENLDLISPELIYFDINPGKKRNFILQGGCILEFLKKRSKKLIINISLSHYFYK